MILQKEFQKNVYYEYIHTNYSPPKTNPSKYNFKTYKKALVIITKKYATIISGTQHANSIALVE